MYKLIETELGGKKLTIETGKLAKQADGAVFIGFGGTRVLVTAVASKEEREGLDFFPLTVDFVEKYYASGKIPGGYLKREARPSDLATLTSRMIDRPIRPLFPENFRAETQIVATVLSYDGELVPIFDKRLKQYCLANNINYFALKDLAEKDYIRYDRLPDGHPTAKLNKFLANQIVRKIDELFLDESKSH